MHEDPCDVEEVVNELNNDRVANRKMEKQKKLNNPLHLWLISKRGSWLVSPKIL